MCLSVETPPLPARRSCKKKEKEPKMDLKIVYRSYGRAPKMIHLESNFVQFKEELLPKEGNKALLTFPFLHIYWTECCVSIHFTRQLLGTHKKAQLPL